MTLSPVPPPARRRGDSRPATAPDRAPSAVGGRPPDVIVPAGLLQRLIEALKLSDQAHEHLLGCRECAMNILGAHCKPTMDTLCAEGRLVTLTASLARGLAKKHAKGLV